MLDIKKVQSTNKVIVCGVLSELNVEEKQTNDGRYYVSATAKVKVDQEVNGKVVENEIPIRAFSMRLKSDGNKNPLYDGIVKWKEDFTSLAAAETPNQASRVSITSGQLGENMWLDKTTNQPKTGYFQVSSNFMRKANVDEPDKATFELSGVIGDMRDEMDANGEETGRLIIKFIVVGYNGRVDVIELIAESPNAVNHIRTNWEKGDTVTLAGAVNMTFKTKVWMEEQGFGPAIERRKTETKRELIILSGSPSGLDEALSYDSDSIKIALDERQARITKLSEKKPVAASTNKSFDVGF